MSALTKLLSRMTTANSLLCVGLDGDLAKVPERFQNVKFPQMSFNRWIIEQTHMHVAAYKPNIAYYESRGEEGIKELKMTMDYLRDMHPDIYLICDAKRADIGVTNEQYAKAVFDYFGFDAITLHPYLGKEALEPFLSRTDKASIILCHTSNPGAGEFQDLLVNGEPLWLRVAKNIATQWNTAGNCMLVVGATYPQEMQLIRSATGNMPFLVPGIGTQGGKISDVMAAGLTPDKLGLLIHSSRDVLFAPDPQAKAEQLKNEINQYRVSTVA